MRTLFFLGLVLALTGCDSSTAGDGETDPSSGNAGSDMLLGPDESDLEEGGAKEPGQEGAEESLEGGGDGLEEEVEIGSGDGCVESLPEGTSVSGRLYMDADAAGHSMYLTSYDADADVGHAGMSVGLFPGGEQAETCADGGFSFNNLEAGSYLLDLSALGDEHFCQSRNCPVRLPLAVAEGEVTIVTFGDSVSVQGANTLFPVHLKGMLEEFAVINSINVAIGGSQSVNWTPETYNFKNELLPLAEEMDVLVASIGGNDILQYAQGAFLSGDIEGAIAGVDAKIKEVMDNVLSAFYAIREVNPDVDLVYCLYPNYPESDQWGQFLTFVPQYAELITSMVYDALVAVREDLPTGEGLILVDMFGAFEDEDLSLLLYDQLHFNEVGHVRYAQEIFQALGGVVVEEGESAVVEFGLAP